MADMVPIAQFPPGQSPALAAAVAALLCTVLGAAQVINGVITAVVPDEATAVARVLAATDTLTTDDGVGFEQARWRAAAEASREVHSA